MKSSLRSLNDLFITCFLSVPQIVDAGVGHSRSGGSSRSSSRSSRSSEVEVVLAPIYTTTDLIRIILWQFYSALHSGIYKFILVGGIILLLSSNPCRVKSEIRVQPTLVMINVRRSIVELNTTHQTLGNTGIQTLTRSLHLGLREATLNCRLPGLEKIGTCPRFEVPVSTLNIVPTWDHSLS